MQFWKVNGTGNDFIILNALTAPDRPGEYYSALAKRLCDRRVSLGADGLMIVLPTKKQADFRMLFFNADGSPSEMCGNGARCLCRFGYEMGLSGERQSIETPAGIICGKRLSAREYRVQLNDPSVVELCHSAEVDGIRYDCAYVELGDPGVPHAVLPYADLERASEEDLRELAQALCHHPAFPKGANIDFYDLTAEDEVFLRTYERGVEEFTLSCGTGSASTVIVLTLRGLVSGEGVRVRSTGGTLLIDMDRVGSRVNRLYLTGTTNFVAKGEITDEELPG